MPRTRGGGSTTIDEDGVLGDNSGAVAPTPVEFESKPDVVVDPNEPGRSRRRNGSNEYARPADYNEDDDSEEEADDDSGGGQEEASPDAPEAGEAPDPVKLTADLAALREEHQKAQATARVYEGLEAAFARDPVGTLARMASSTGVDAQALAQALGVAPNAGQPQGPVFDPSAYEPESEFETAMIPHYQFLQEAPAVLEQMREGQAGLVDVVDEVYLRGMVLSERLAAVMEHLGLGDEEFDLGAFANAMRAKQAQGPVDVQAELSAAYGAKLRSKLAVAKQAGAARPETPRGGSGATGKTRRKVSSFAEAAKAVAEGW